MNNKDIFQLIEEMKLLNNTRVVSILKASKK